MIGGYYQTTDGDSVREFLHAPISQKWIRLPSRRDPRERMERETRGLYWSERSALYTISDRIKLHILWDLTVKEVEMPQDLSVSVSCIVDEQAIRRLPSRLRSSLSAFIRRNGPPYLMLRSVSYHLPGSKRMISEILRVERPRIKTWIDTVYSNFMAFVIQEEEQGR